MVKTIQSKATIANQMIAQRETEMAEVRQAIGDVNNYLEIYPTNAEPEAQKAYHDNKDTLLAQRKKLKSAYAKLQGSQNRWESYGKGHTGKLSAVKLHEFDDVFHVPEQQFFQEIEQFKDSLIKWASAGRKARSENA